VIILFVKSIKKEKRPAVISACLSFSLTITTVIASIMEDRTQNGKSPNKRGEKEIIMNLHLL
jgi:hypothetical protein